MAYTNDPIANPYLRLSFYLYCTIHKTTPREKKSNKLLNDYDVYETNRKTEVTERNGTFPQMNWLIVCDCVQSWCLIAWKQKWKTFQYEFDLISMEKSTRVMCLFDEIFVCVCVYSIFYMRTTIKPINFVIMFINVMF